MSDSIFAGKASRELRLLFPGKVSNIRHFGSYALSFLADIAVIPDEAIETLKKSDATFISALIPIVSTIYYGNDISEVATALESILPKGGTFKLEVKKVLSSLKPGAKELEVVLGRHLEKQGIRANLSNPDRIAYVMLIRDTAYLGMLDAANAIVLDKFRSANRGVPEKVSRAEFKIEEAIEAFGIETSKMHACIDIGAAPGGWTDCMARRGVKVLAIDNALLDYAKLQQSGSVCAVLEPSQERKVDVRTYPIGDLAVAVSDNLITHLIANADFACAPTLALGMKFDALLMDVNAPPSRSAEMACNFSEALNSGAVLIMTIKMVDERISENISETKASLSKCFTNMRVKKLAHDRHELTLYAIRT